MIWLDEFHLNVRHLAPGEFKLIQRHVGLLQIPGKKFISVILLTTGKKQLFSLPVTRSALKILTPVLNAKSHLKKS
jgi:hypothetical protein